MAPLGGQGRGMVMIWGCDTQDPRGTRPGPHHSTFHFFVSKVRLAVLTGTELQQYIFETSKYPHITVKDPEKESASSV